MSDLNNWIPKQARVFKKIGRIVTGKKDFQTMKHIVDLK